MNFRIFQKVCAVSVIIGVMLLSLLLPTGCRTPGGSNETPVLFSPDSGSLGPHEKELKEVLRRIPRGEWEEARAEMASLYAKFPQDASVDRVYNWLEVEYEKQRQ